MNLNADTITDDDIRHLRAEAGNAGDEAMVTICTAALAGTPSTRTSSAYGARGKCARAINDARDSE